MFNHLTRERPDTCVSDLAMDAWMADDLPAPRAQEVARHVAGCTRCRARHRQLLADRQAMFPGDGALAAHATRKQASGAGRQRGWLAASVGGAALAALAAAALLTLQPGADAPAERAKGTASLPFFFVRHGGAVSRAGEGATVPAGASIRFVYSTAEPVYLAIISRDPRGEFSVYYPSGALAARLAPGQEVALDSAVRLDASQGPETLWALFCKQATAVDSLHRALRAGPHPETSELVEGCRVQVMHFRKVAP